MRNPESLPGTSASGDRLSPAAPLRSARTPPLLAAMLLGLLACAGVAGGQYNAEIGAEIRWITAERVPLVREAAFGLEGESATIIAYPARRPESRPLADRIQSALREKFGILAPIVSSADIAEDDYRGHTVIHLGNIYTNPALLWFYLHSFTYADASWPGADGWAIQQAYDPKGFGTNVLILAASSDAGLESGVARFVEEIDRLERPAWTEFLLVESETPPVTGTPAALSGAEVADLEKEFLEAMRNERLLHTAEQAIWDAKFYLMSGNEDYLAPLRACVPAHLQYLREGGNQQAETIYFWFFKYAQIWDAVEHSDYWDDEFRETMTNLLYWLSEVIVSIGHFERSINPYPKNNHETYAAISLLFSSLYFQKYYDLERADYWRGLADGVFQTQAGFARGMDESRHYYEHAGMHSLFYAIATGDRTFIESGNARRFADILLMLVDNTGDNPNFGDGRASSNNRTFYYLLPFANVSGEPAYLGLSNLAREYAKSPQSIWAEGWRGHSHSLQHYIPPVEPELPPLPPAIRVLELEEALYRREREDPVFAHLPPPGEWIPYEQTFDKIAFRNGYDRQNQYLLLDGYGRGIHSHQDANVITRFTDNGRIWLVDDTYFRNSAAYHNSLMVIRDGRGGFGPPFAALETISSMERTGFTRTTAPDFNGVDWTRNIFWIKEDVLVVLDEVLARQPGEYTLQTFWRGLGEMTERPAGVQLDQAGESFAISFPANLGIRSEADYNNVQDEQSWGEYPYAEPVVKRTMAYQTPTMAPGDRRSFSAVLYTFPTAEPRAIEARNLTDTTLLVREAEETRLYFAGAEGLPGFFDTDARMGIVTPDFISLTGATRITLNGTTLLQESAPVSCEIDLAEGKVTTISQEEARVSDLAMTREMHAARMTRRDLNDASTIAAGLARELDKLWSETPLSERRDAQAEGPGLVPDPLQTFDRRIHAALILEFGGPSVPGFLLATDEGVEAWSSTAAAPLWRYPTSAPVQSATAATFGGEPAIVFGTTRGKIVALNPDGSERWVHQLPRRRVFSMSAADTNHDGNDEILITASHWMSYLLDSSGGLIRGERVARNNLISSAFGDLNGDGNRELLIGSENFRMHAFTPDFKILWSFRTKRGTVDRIQTADIDGDGADEVLIGSSDGHVYAVKSRSSELVPTPYHERDPALTPHDIVFEFDTGGDVFAIATGDLDGNGEQKVIVGSDSFFLYRFAADGTREGMINAGDMVRHIAVLDEAPAPYRIAAGLANGRILLLTPALELSALAELGSEILDIQYDPETNRLYAIGRSSFGVFPLE